MDVLSISQDSDEGDTSQEETENNNCIEKSLKSRTNTDNDPDHQYCNEYVKNILENEFYMTRPVISATDEPLNSTDLQKQPFSFFFTDASDSISTIFNPAIFEAGQGSKNITSVFR